MIGQLQRSTRPRRLLELAILIGMIGLMSGCAGSQWIRERRYPASPLADDMRLFSWRGPKPTSRTVQELRRFDLLSDIKDDPKSVLQELTSGQLHSNASDHTVVVAEVAFLAGLESADEERPGEALDYFGISVAEAYHYLLSPHFGHARNAFDPRFRQASDLYNASLERIMRIIQDNGMLKPGTVHIANTAHDKYELHIVCRGPWAVDDIKELKFVADFDLKGLKNHYRTYGLGVPMIAVHRDQPGNSPAEAYYPPGMSFPATAFLRVVDQKYRTDRGLSEERHVCVLEIHDPTRVNAIPAEGQLVPLETDLTVPLAYGLSDPNFRRANVATLGLLNPEGYQNHQGLYLLEPFDPDKIPVLMIHGLWSSLITWMEMFNDLRGDPSIRERYQFWFYAYPSGQPLMLTATQLRQSLKEVRERLDPNQNNQAMRQMVLVGHSMGGLVARLQTLESRDDYWKLVSDLPANEITGDEDIDRLRNAVFFHPNADVARVVTIASPHRGSNFANDATRWIGRQLINVPELFERTRHSLVVNHSELRNQGLLEIQTSIDSLSPMSPVLEIMQKSPEAEWTRYHNIVGVVADEGVLLRVAGQSDGVVTLDSAKLASAESELIVQADHVNIHRHPKTVMEVQRILLEHLDQLQRSAIRRLPEVVDPVR